MVREQEHEQHGSSDNGSIIGTMVIVATLVVVVMMAIATVVMAVVSQWR